MSGTIGEIVVAGLVTGTHVIEDIGVAVPHQVAVRIPADMALRSRDLWIGIQQGRLFKLDGGAGLHVASQPSQDGSRIAQLEAENKRLRQELLDEKMRSEGLYSVIGGFQAQLKGVQTALGRLESLPRSESSSRLALGSAASNVKAEVEAPSVVGGDVPTFLPQRIRPENAETQIRSSTETAEKSNVSSATSKLRELKKGAGGSSES